MASKSEVLYIGVTNNLERRVFEHKAGQVDGFTKRYRVNRLVYYEAFRNVSSAIKREKYLKGWKRIRKLELIWSVNPSFAEWSEEWD